jgi:hypothetical protein
MTVDENKRKSSRQGSRLRAVLFRFGAVLIGLLLLALLELTLRLAVPSHRRSLCIVPQAKPALCGRSYGNPF